MIGRLNHVAIAVPDLAGAAELYRGTLGAKVSAPLMLHLAGLDKRVGATAWPFASALGDLGKDVAVFDYPGVNHAFNNDTSAERYDKAAADLAWARTLRFFGLHLSP